MKFYKFLLYVGVLVVTFFINFTNLAFRLSECGFGKYPCVSDSFYLPVVTSYLNFNTQTSCGGFTGQCFPGGFSERILIADIIWSIILFFLILLVIKLIRKSSQKSV